MFLRIVKSGGHKYINLVENKREGKKVKQTVVASLGRIDGFSRDEVMNMINKLKQWYSLEEIVDITKTQENVIKNYGAKIIVERLFKEYELDKYFSNIDAKISYDIKGAIELMVMNRLMEPKSKLGIYKELDYYGMEEIELQHIYRSLDVIEQRKDEIEKEMYLKRLSLFNSMVDLVFYDVTTLSFESQKVNELMNYGYSKDKKFNETQVVIGMSVDKERFPVSFNVYEGNTFEGHTMKYAIEEMKKKYHLGKIIIVADRGMLSQENIKTVEESGYEYIVGRSVKKLEKSIDIFSEGYVEIAPGIKAKEIDYQGKRLIIAYSQERAKKDEQDRIRLVEKAKKIIERHGVTSLNKRGSMKYIKKKEDKKEKDEYELCIEKIRQDSKYDGYFGIVTNTKESINSIIEQYHNLWEVEESFRTFKDFLQIRPMFHWTVKRIIGHTTMVFISYVLLKTLEKKLKDSGIEYSHEKIRRAIRKMEYAEMKVEDKEFAVRSNLDEFQKEILKILNIPQPKKVEVLESFKQKVTN